MQLQVQHRQVVVSQDPHPRLLILIRSTRPEQVMPAKRITRLLHQVLLDFHHPVQATALYRVLVVMPEDMKDQVVMDVLRRKLECTLRGATVS